MESYNFRVTFLVLVMVILGLKLGLQIFIFTCPISLNFL